MCGMGESSWWIIEMPMERAWWVLPILTSWPLNSMLPESGA
jgi:hypothetical protein